MTSDGGTSSPPDGRAPLGRGARPERAPEAATRVILWGPLPPPAGGLSRWVQNYVAAAPAAGVAVDVVDTSPGSGIVDTKSRFRPARVLRATHALVQLQRLLAQRRPDVVHLCTTMFWATPREALAIELCRRAGAPAVLHVHMSPQIIAWHRALPWPKRRAVSAVLGRAAAVITMSQDLKAYLQGLLPDSRLVCIPNPVDTDRFLPAAPRSPGRRMRVLFAGLITPKKGIVDLARAVLAVEGVTLALAGPRGVGYAPGSDRQFDHALRELERRGRLELLGEVSPEAMPETYREADVFCLPSYGEGLPNALLEAMASGLPCVVTPVGGMLEVIEGDGGHSALVVQPGDVAALTSTLRSLRDLPSLRMQLGEAARQRVVSRYGPQRVMAEYATLYAALKEGAAP